MTKLTDESFQIIVIHISWRYTRQLKHHFNQSGLIFIQPLIMWHIQLWMWIISKSAICFLHLGMCWKNKIFSFYLSLIEYCNYLLTSIKNFYSLEISDLQTKNSITHKRSSWSSVLFWISLGTSFDLELWKMAWIVIPQIINF